MNRGSSASIHSGSHLASALAISSCHHLSRPAVISHLILSPTLLTTITLYTDGDFVNASSAIVFAGTALLPRKVPSQTTSTLASPLTILSLSASALNPPKTMQ